MRSFVCYRFTPTCVGITSQARMIRPRQPVHPHVRGDHPGRSRGMPGRCGSPPRAWGSLVRTRGLVDSGRFTPTCVGITSISFHGSITTPVHPHVRGDHSGSNSRDPSRTVHPHVRGDHDARNTDCEQRVGSPPRAWGSPTQGSITKSVVRFTPTCVGITVFPGPEQNTLTVHPHVRGDHLYNGGVPVVPNGSPPRAWGSRADSGRNWWRLRFTPTCVGITVAGQSRELQKTVHPHVRGDHWINSLQDQLQAGSPPRAWGSPGLGVFAARPSRFTPTCVGITTPTISSNAASTVHPHVRGDHFSRIRQSDHSRGSPPRAWGSLITS